MVSKAKSVNTFNVNGTKLAQVAPSVNLVDTNFTSNGQNYTSVENLTFSASAKPILNGLNVQFPAAAYTIESFITNRSANLNKITLDSHILNFTAFSSATNVTFAFGNAVETLLKINKTVAQFGNTKVFSNVLISPSTVLTVGPNTIGVNGVVSFTGNSSSSSYNQLEVSVNGGSTKYINFSKSTTIGPVTLNPGPGYLTNTSGNFLKSLSVSSIAYNQNITNINTSTSHVAIFPGLTALNMTVLNGTKANGGQFVLTNTQGFTLSHSFTGVSNFVLPEGLTNISLQKLVPILSEGSNATVTVGKAKSNAVNVTINKTTFNIKSNVPNIGVGAGALYSNVNIPGKITFGTSATLNMTNILSNDSLLYSVTTTNGGTKGGNILPGQEGLTNNVSLAFASLSSTPGAALHLAVTNATLPISSNSAFQPVVNGSNTDNVFYRLPNGQYLEFKYADVTSATNATTIENLTSIVNFTAASTAAPTTTAVAYSGMKPFYKVYGGYNVTVKPFNYTGLGIHVHAFLGRIGAVNITAPVSTLEITTGAHTYSILPGFSGMYAANNSRLSKVANGALGYFTFNGSAVTFTDPLGEVLTANVKAYSNGTTYFTSTVNSSAANTWGSYLDFVKAPNTAEFTIPTQNYTLAVGGATHVSNALNYTRS